MLGLEPKELPVGILINMESEGRYVKDRMFGVTVWLAEDIHCADCAEIVFDEPTPELIVQAGHGFYKVHKVHEESSQEFFGMDWSIVSVPWHFAVLLAKEVHDQPRSGGLITDHILKHAILRYTKAEEEDN